MQYLLLIYNTETNPQPPTENTALMKEYGDFTRGIIESGHYKGGNAPAARIHRYIRPRA